MSAPSCGYMTYEIGCDPGTHMVPVAYEFLWPAMLRIRKLDGRIVPTMFGFAEKIEIFQPAVQYLNVPHKRLETILMADGSEIIEYPENLRARRVRNRSIDQADLPGR
jgi:hypothetical protein